MKIDVLDRGYVRLVKFAGFDKDPLYSGGDDLTNVNAARASMEKESTEWTDKDERLGNFLLNDGDTPRRIPHDSPYRHSTLTFEVKAPMIVKNQWFKYLIGHDHTELEGEVSFRDPFFAWNESSRRYVTSEPEFYIPRWRSKPASKKQGSGAPVNGELDTVLSQAMQNHVDNSIKMYQATMDHGVAPEQARGWLPAYLLYIRWYWTGSLWGVIHLLRQRKDPDAQWEFREYANAVEKLASQKFPHAIKAAQGIING